jgi:hypothetical protein
MEKIPQIGFEVKFDENLSIKMMVVKNKLKY